LPFAHSISMLKRIAPTRRTTPVQRATLAQ
jgi:hypothetical protein